MTIQSPSKSVSQITKRQRAMLAEMGISVWLPAASVHTTTDTAPSVQTHSSNTSSTPQAATIQPSHKPAQTATAQTAATEKSTDCPECTNAIANVPSLQNNALPPNNPQLPRWLFVLDSVDKDSPCTTQADKAQVLLKNMVAALRLQGEQVQQCHACACFRTKRPSNTANTPHTAHTPEVCSTWLLHEIMRTQPQVIVALGRQAAFSVLGSAAPLGSLRNSTHHIAIAPQHAPHCPDWITQIPVLVSYPLNYLLRTPAAKARAWQDLCLAHSVVHATTS